MNKEKKSNIKSIILQISIILCIVLAYFLIDFNSIYQSLKGETSFVTQDETCNLHKDSCSVKMKDGTKFILSIEPKSIPLMEKLTFSIKSNKDSLKNLTLNIYATNMFMGEFVLPIKNLGNGNYKAVGTLPTCPVGGMEWNADIIIRKATENIGARFKFKTDI